MRRYYCEIVPDSLSHVAPSITMLLEELQARRECPGSILDVGCGNGRNSVSLSSRFNAQVTVVDPDEYMLGWALRSFNVSGRSDVEAIRAGLEQISSDSTMMRARKFDIVILSYVLQHIEPSFYPAVFDFLRDICQGYLALDVFWNPSRCEPGSTAKIGSTTWHGIRYEDLVQLIAPRFEIIRQKVQVDESSVIINLVARRGVTPTERIITREYNYYLGQLHVSCRGWAPKRNRRAELLSKIETLQSFLHLSSIYPAEMDYVKSEISEWVQGEGRITTDLLGAKFLLLCRATRVPVFIREVLRDFSLSGRSLFKAMETCGYVPRLQTSGYIERASKELGLGDSVLKRACDLEVGEEVGGTSPAVRAGCAIIKSATEADVSLKLSDVAKHLSVSATSLRINLAHGKFPGETEGGRKSADLAVVDG